MYAIDSGKTTRFGIACFVLVVAGLALVAASGTAVAETGDAGTASVDAADDDDCLVQGCGCPDPRICSGAPADPTVEPVESELPYCPPEEYPCDCSDPRICSGVEVEAAFAGHR